MKEVQEIIKRGLEKSIKITLLTEEMWDDYEKLKNYVDPYMSIQEQILFVLRNSANNRLLDKDLWEIMTSIHDDMLEFDVRASLLPLLSSGLVKYVDNYVVLTQESLK